MNLFSLVLSIQGIDKEDQNLSKLNISSRSNNNCDITSITKLKKDEITDANLTGLENIGSFKNNDDYMAGIQSSTSAKSQNISSVLFKALNSQTLKLELTRKESRKVHDFFKSFFYQKAASS